MHAKVEIQSSVYSWLEKLCLILNFFFLSYLLFHMN